MRIRCGYQYRLFSNVSRSQCSMSVSFAQRAQRPHRVQCEKVRLKTKKQKKRSLVVYNELERKIRRIIFGHSIQTTTTTKRCAIFCPQSVNRLSKMVYRSSENCLAYEIDWFDFVSARFHCDVRIFSGNDVRFEFDTVRFHLFMLLLLLLLIVCSSNLFYIWMEPLKRVL